MKEKTTPKVRNIIVKKEENSSKKVLTRGTIKIRKSNRIEEKPKIPLKKDDEKIKFRLSTKGILLTYPQCSIEIDSLQSLIFEKLSKYNIKEYFIGRELHEDENPHFHVYVKLDKKVDIKRHDFLDLEVLDEKGEIVKYHGRYESAKKRENVINYITKDIFTKSQANSQLRMSDNIKAQLSKVYSLVDIDHRLIMLAKNGEVTKALKMVEEEDYKRFVKEGRNLEQTLKWIHMRESGCVRRYNFEDFRIPAGLSRCFETFEKCILENEPKVLVLIGKSGCGKTQLAITYFEQQLNEKALRLSCFDGIRFLKDETLLLYDDFNWKNLSREEILSLLDQGTNTIVNVKHSSQMIPGKIKRCIISNFPLHYDNIHFSHDSISRRLLVYNMPNDEILFEAEENKSKSDILVENYMEEVGDRGDRPHFKNMEEFKRIVNNYSDSDKAQYVEKNKLDQYFEKSRVPRTSADVKRMREEAKFIKRKIKDDIENSDKIIKQSNQLEKQIRSSIYKKAMDEGIDDLVNEV